ncbi:MAG: hypothetical protein LCH84_15020 [Gemmatimonadetes bacterium]|nr:hypothetical protein [Gemmatimonadota bacterium]
MRRYRPFLLAARPHLAVIVVRLLLLVAVPAFAVRAQGGAASGSAAGATTSGAAGAAEGAVSVTSLVREADHESAARHSAAALALYERALQLDARAVPALVGAARELVDLGEFDTSADRRTTRFRRAVEYARRAVAVQPGLADAHFHLARALGRTALNLGARERVKYAVEVRDAAQQALTLEPRHAGALHVIGVWHAEVMRLNGFERAFARAFLGGAVFASASWAEALRHLELAVAVEPDRLVHRLDLARVQRDAGRLSEARASYEAALRCPDTDANDGQYRQAAEAELRRLRR